MKKIFKRWFLIFFSYSIGRLAYDKRYFKGKYFEKDGIGWSWVFKSFFKQKIWGVNKTAQWPVNPQIKIGNPNNIEFDINDLHIFHTYGTYFQAIGAKIKIGQGCYIGPNVAIITSNHDLYDLDKHSCAKEVIIGKKCWVGYGAVILPGVVLGDNTIVGANAVVTRSFTEGNVVLGGIPAKIIKKL